MAPTNCVSMVDCGTGARDRRKSLNRPVYSAGWCAFEKEKAKLIVGNFDLWYTENEEI